MKQKLKKPIMSIKSMGSTMPQVSGVHCTMCSLYSMFSFQPNKLRHNLCLDIRFNIYLSHTLSFLCFFLLILPQSWWSQWSNETQKLIKPIMSIKSKGSTMPQGSGVHCTMCSLNSMFSFQPNKLRYLCLDICGHICYCVSSASSENNRSSESKLTSL